MEGIVGANGISVKSLVVWNTRAEYPAKEQLKAVATPYNLFRYYY